MALCKKNVYRRFCDGAMMKAWKTAWEQTAAAHRLVPALTKNVENDRDLKLRSFPNS